MPKAASAAASRIPRGVWMLGFVSLFMDMSSELVHSLLPVFMAGTLGASALLIGLVEGAAEALALIVKVFSGYLSDVMGRRKPVVLFGYGLAALTKPLFPLASSIGLVLGARLLDRVGKGMRGAPRDALVADITPEAVRGSAFGLRQSMDTVGAILGPALAIAFMLWFAGSVRNVLWVAVVPAAISIAFLVFGVIEPERKGKPVAAKLPFSKAGLRALGGAYWRVVLVGAVLTLARFTEAFLVLRGSNLGLSATWVPLVMVVMSLSYALCAWPAGHWSDRVPRALVLALGLVFLAAAHAALACAAGTGLLYLGVVLWGVHLGLTQGVISALIADVAPGALRGTAFGVFNLASGLVLLAGSAGAGAMWDRIDPSAPFWAGAALALVGAVSTLALPRGAVRAA